MKKLIAGFTAGFLAITGLFVSAGNASAEKLCIATPAWTETIEHPAEKVHETQWKKTVETSDTQYRFKTRTWIEKYKEIKSVKGWDFVSGGTTTVRNQVVAGHWVKSDGMHQIPDVIINIVWGPNGPPDGVLGTGYVNLSVYGGPSVSVFYKAEKINFSGWSDYGPWSDWSSKKVTGSDSVYVETREVPGDFYVIYYNPKGDPTRDLTDANWTITAPGGNWVLVDERDRITKEAWTEKIEHPATYKPCEPEGKTVVRTFQVDTYVNPTTKLANKAAGYDNDGKLKWAEDKPHYGYSYYQVVKVTGKSDWNDAQWMDAINHSTTAKGVGSVNSTSHIKTVKKGARLTVAWEIKSDSWTKKSNPKRGPQYFFARGI